MNNKGTTIKERITALEVAQTKDKELNTEEHKGILDAVNACNKLIGNHLAHTTWWNRTLIVALITVVVPYIVYGAVEIFKHTFMK